MAQSTLQDQFNSSNQEAQSPASEAFVRAFREFHRLDDPAEDLTDTPEYQLAMYAYEGAQERAVSGHLSDHDGAAAAALVAFAKVQAILDGAFVTGGGPLVDEDERSELRGIQRALQNLWRFHDREGGGALRRYAEYVGAVERCDSVAWRTRP